MSAMGPGLELETGRRPAERLSGEAVFAPNGNRCEPSEALPYTPRVKIPTMLVDRELSYLHWLASRLTGAGRAVELGPFLGGSTQALVTGKRLSAGTRPLLSYDAFETMPDIERWHRKLLERYGLKPGQRFRELFDHNLQHASDHISVRDGWLPPDATREQEAVIYPEQEPIELLFIDIAKSWEVNLAVLRTFGRHLIPGAIIVQQDFFDLPTPWIALHMYQLRDVLEPLDVLHRTPTVSFRCVGSVADQLDRLWTQEDLRDPDARRDAWHQVRAYWDGKIGTGPAGVFQGHAAMHALMTNEIDEFVRLGRGYEAWNRSFHSETVYFMPAWPHILSSLPGELQAEGIESQEVRSLAAECIARGQRADRFSPKERSDFCPAPLRHHVWEAAIERLRRLGHQYIALMGAGKHTRWLLADFEFPPDIRVECILDDRSEAEDICGVPVVPTTGYGAHLTLVTAIVPSSDSIEDRLVSRITELLDNQPAIHIERVYTHPDVSASLRLNLQYEIQPNPEHAWTNLRSSGDAAADLLAEHRRKIGLPPCRPWLDELIDRYRLPSWATGYTRLCDVAFLWDFIEVEQPRSIVEIGTAAGVSTSMLLHGADLLSSPDCTVHSFDILSHCYFNVAWHTGDAIGEMAPQLVGRARLFARADALDAASCFGIGEIDLLFIDANHAHPAPTLDLLSLIYAVRPGSWVVLHDIELPHLDGSRADWGVRGAAELFNRWPFAKVQVSGSCRAERNIGAIRMPARPDEAIAPLLGMLRPPYETGGEPARQARRAWEIFSGSTFPT